MAPGQVQAIGKMHPPITKKQIQALTGKLAALNRFISRYLDHLQPFFAALKRASSKGLGPECDKAFQSIKEYISSPLFLSQLIDGEELYLYLAASATSMSAALVRADEDSKQKPIYSVSKMLTNVETRCIDFERIVLALRMVPKKQRPYFQAHTIVVLTSYLIRAILYKLDASGRLLKWIVELSEFDIEYRLRCTIKGQALADFIIKMSDVQP